MAEAISYNLRTDMRSVVQERQQLRLGYGEYAALRGVSHLGRSPLRQILADYQDGVRWYDLSERNGARLAELSAWLSDIQRAAGGSQGRLRDQPSRPVY